MDSLICDLEQLKLSALQKLQVLNSSYVLKPDPIPEKTKKEKKIKNKKINKYLDEKPLEYKTDNEIENVIRKLETKRHQEVKNRVQAHINKFEDFTKQQELDRQQQWLRIQENFEQENQQKENSIFLAMQEYDKNSSNSHAKLAQYYQNLNVRRQMHEQELKLREQRTQMLHNCIDKIKKHQQEFNEAYEQVIPLLKKCDDEMKSKIGEEYNLLKVLPINFEKVITKCKTLEVNEEDEKQAAKILDQLKALRIRMKEIVEEAVKKNEVKIPKKPEVVPILPASNPPVRPVPVLDEIAPRKVHTKVSSISRYISMSNLKMYTDAMEFYDKHTDSFKNLLDDTSQKQFKFDCKKAINIPVNSLSGVNSEHVLDKFNRLRTLLNGQDVVVSNSRINASKHPQGVPFCMDLLAKKFVLQGDLMVSCNPDSAFCYATVMSSLWNDFPTFGQLLLANFYKSCPYLVPYCIPREVGQSDEEFYSRLGYQYKDGQIETQDKFLKRMTGIMRLYAALMIVKPKKDHKSTPHNISHGWRWFSSMLKLEPQVDITVTMLHTFLETAGFEMEAKYGSFFRKLIMVLVDKFLPNCREKCTGGATTRLELLLTNYFKNKKFEKPNGYLDYSYW